MDAISRLRHAVGMLRAARTPSELVQRIPAAADFLGFDLVLYAHLNGDRWTPVAGHVARRVAERGRARDRAPSGCPGFIGLPDPRSIDCSCPERVVLEELEPVLVDTSQDRGGLVSGWPCRSALAIPVVDRGVAIGLLHAGRIGVWSAPGDLDEQLLWMLAEAAGAQMAAARAVGSLHDIASRMTELAGELGHPGVTPPDTIERSGLAPVVPAALTARESDVLELVAAGLTNGQIARRLVITEGTAKSHIKRILRKLGAANRAEATAAWMRMSSEASCLSR